MLLAVSGLRTDTAEWATLQRSEPEVAARLAPRSPQLCSLSLLEMGQISVHQWLAEERHLCLCNASVNFARSFESLPPPTLPEP